MHATMIKATPIKIDSEPFDFGQSVDKDRKIDSMRCLSIKLWNTFYTTFQTLQRLFFCLDNDNMPYSRTAALPQIGGKRPPENIDSGVQDTSIKRPELNTRLVFLNFPLSMLCYCCNSKEHQKMKQRHSEIYIVRITYGCYGGTETNHII